MLTGFSGKDELETQQRAACSFCSSFCNVDWSWRVKCTLLHEPKRYREERGETESAEMFLQSDLLHC